MYLLHIKPIQPGRASERVADAYEEIKETLHIQTVPLVFQYVAIYEPYFFYLWERIKRNLDSDDFHNSCAELKEVIYQTVAVLPTPSVPLRNFVQELHPSERYAITEAVNLLDDVNIRLMLITVGIRESLKGIPHVAPLLPDQKKDVEEQFASMIRIETPKVQDEDNKEITQASRMLAPLLGNDTLMISHHADFFATIAAEMKQLKNMPAYLHLRVALEHMTFERIDRFVQPLDCSFVDFLRMTDGIPYTDEILFLLKDTFPSQFPHLVLTTGVMKNALGASNAMVPGL